MKRIVKLIPVLLVTLLILSSCESRRQFELFTTEFANPIGFFVPSQTSSGSYSFQFEDWEFSLMDSLGKEHEFITQEDVYHLEFGHFLVDLGDFRDLSAVTDLRLYLVPAGTNDRMLMASRNVVDQPFSKYETLISVKGAKLDVWPIFREHSRFTWILEMDVDGTVYQELDMNLTMMYSTGAGNKD